jgi:hypothetical protein
MLDKHLKYKNKYLKYKNKYLNLLSQIGGKVKVLEIDANQKIINSSLAFIIYLKEDDWNVNTALQRHNDDTILDLSKAEISDFSKITRFLFWNTTLTTLLLEAVIPKIEFIDVDYLNKVLTKNKTLTHLDINDNNIRSNGAIEIEKILSNNTTLKIFKIGKNHIHHTRGAEAIARGLGINRTLETLVIRENNIGPEGATAIAEALGRNIKLSTLDIYNIKLNAEGAIAIAYALQINRTLTTLEMSLNNIGAKGAKAIAKALLRNNKLITLGIGDNNIGTKGAKAIAKALITIPKSSETISESSETIPESSETIPESSEKTQKASKKTQKPSKKTQKPSKKIWKPSKTILQRLLLYNNDISDIGIIAIINALKRNNTINYVNITNNNITDEKAFTTTESDLLKLNSNITIEW